MDFYVALDKDNCKLIDGGTTIQSNIIYIPLGYVGLLSLYNMVNVISLQEGEANQKSLVNNSCLTLKKISFGKVDDVQLEDICGKPISINDEYARLLSSRRVFTEPVIQDGRYWTINPCNNYVSIPIPGFYILESKAVDQLDTMHVEYATMPATHAIAIPDGFKLGK